MNCHLSQSSDFFWPLWKPVVALGALVVIPNSSFYYTHFSFGIGNPCAWHTIFIVPLRHHLIPAFICGPGRHTS